MLAANEGVARFFEVRALPTVYRITTSRIRRSWRRSRRWRARTDSSCPRARS